MGRLTDDMYSLRHDTDALRGERESFILNLKHGVVELKDDVSDMQSGFCNDHAEMAGSLREKLEAFVADIKANVLELQEEAVDMQKGFQDDHANMARQLKDTLGTFVSELESSVEGMTVGFRNNRAEMAQQLKDTLGTFVSELKSSVEGMTVGFRNDRTEMAQQLREEQKAFMSGIVQSVVELQQKTAALREEFTTDILGARTAWSGVSTVTPKPKKTAKPHAAEKRAQPKEVKAEAEQKPVIAESQTEKKKIIEKVDHDHDDLTQIKGIGPGRKIQLNKGGIYTFSQLAKSTPDTLREIIGDVVTKLVAVENWIEQAKQL